MFLVPYGTSLDCSKGTKENVWSLDLLCVCVYVCVCVCVCVCVHVCIIMYILTSEKEKYLII